MNVKEEKQRRLKYKAIDTRSKGKTESEKEIEKEGKFWLVSNYGSQSISSANRYVRKQHLLGYLTKFNSLHLSKRCHLPANVCLSTFDRTSVIPIFFFFSIFFLFAAEKG